jgi:hypothetical protein
MRYPGGGRLVQLPPFDMRSAGMLNEKAPASDQDRRSTNSPAKPRDDHSIELSKEL